MELTLLQRAEHAERATANDEFRIISEAALAVFGWQDARYKKVLRLLEAGASLDAAMTLVPEGFHLFSLGETRFMLRGPWLAQLDDWQEIPARYHAAAATPALALTAASLRALAHSTPPVVKAMGSQSDGGKA